MAFLNDARRVGLTKTEEAIVSYIAENAEALPRMSLHELASASFASPASVTRLSRKLGYASYGEMQVSIARELAENGSLVPIDADFPDLDNSSPAKLANTLASLEVQSIRATQRLLAQVNLNPIVNEIIRRRMLCVLGLGFSNACIHTFKANMERLGYTVITETDWSRVRTIATECDVQFLPILISYSGGTDTVDMARLFKARGMRTLSITSEGSNDLKDLTTWNLPVARMERPFINDRVAPIASVTSTEYVLNLLYLAVFDRARERNALTLTESIVRQYDAMKIPGEVPIGKSLEDPDIPELSRRITRH